MRFAIVYAAVLCIACLLSGCAGLSINADISYRSDVPVGERKP